MKNSTFSASERDELVRKYWETWRNLSYPAIESISDKEAEEIIAEKNRLIKEYAEHLPFVKAGRCPLCEAILEYPMDIMGLDGPWWAKGPLAEYPRPQGCEHFRVLLGAIDFHGIKPAEAKPVEEALPGPGAPFVVPRMVELPTMKTVISSFRLPRGYTAYAIAYFSEEPLHGAFLHQPWAREAYQALDENGEYQGWTVANDLWDFDLQPWVERGLLWWINPGDDSLTLHQSGPFPYADTPGVRAPQLIKDGELEQLALPTGQDLDIFG